MATAHAVWRPGSLAAQGFEFDKADRPTDEAVCDGCGDPIVQDQLIMLNLDTDAGYHLACFPFA